MCAIAGAIHFPSPVWCLDKAPAGASYGARDLHNRAMVNQVGSCTYLTVRVRRFGHLQHGVDRHEKRASPLDRDARRQGIVECASLSWVNHPVPKIKAGFQRRGWPLAFGEQSVSILVGWGWGLVAREAV